jgi:hypothetical protein
MKTNHRRGFVDPGSFRDRSCEKFGSSKHGAGKVTSIGNDFTNGHRGHARAVRGAKTALRHADRRYHKKVTKTEMGER